MMSYSNKTSALLVLTAGLSVAACGTSKGASATASTATTTSQPKFFYDFPLAGYATITTQIANPTTSNCPSTYTTSAVDNTGVGEWGWHLAVDVQSCSSAGYWRLNLTDGAITIRPPNESPDDYNRSPVAGGSLFHYLDQLAGLRSALVQAKAPLQAVSYVDQVAAYLPAKSGNQIQIHDGFAAAAGQSSGLRVSYSIMQKADLVVEVINSAGDSVAQSRVTLAAGMGQTDVTVKMPTPLNTGLSPVLCPVGHLVAVGGGLDKDLNAISNGAQCAFVATAPKTN